MNRIITSFLLLAVCAVVFFAGCKDDNGTDLTGTYSRMHQIGSESYLVELQFANDGVLHWTPVDSIPGHTASMVKYECNKAGQFRIYDDPECGNEATYTYSATNEALTLTALSDPCDPRKEAMSGAWDRK